MFRWCSYCQKFLGESEPRSDFSLTHGICSPCKEKLPDLTDDNILASKAVGDFFHELSRLVRLGQPTDLKLVVSRAEAIGIERADLLMGILQPLLYQIGKWNAEGVVTAAQGHVFSQFVESLIHELKQGFRQSAVASSAGTQILLGCADGNYHYFGIRFLELALVDAGISAQAIFPSLPLPELLCYGQIIGAEVVGISVSEARHLHQLSNLDAVLNRLPGYHPMVIAGGRAICGSSEIFPGIYKFNGSMADLVLALKEHLNRRALEGLSREGFLDKSKKKAI